MNRPFLADVVSFLIIATVSAIFFRIFINAL